MKIELTELEFRRLIDLVYVGNWVLNSIRTDDRIEDYDIVEEKIFSLCPGNGMSSLTQRWRGHYLPSKAYEDGGIHEAIAEYESEAFFDILAEELAYRDMQAEGDASKVALEKRIEEYLAEFEESGVENLRLSE